MYPSFGQFCRWAATYSAVPLWLEPELPPGDLMEWVHSLAGTQQKFFFLQSASTGPQARYSYIALDSPRHSAEVKDGMLTLRYNARGDSRLDSLKIGNPFERFHEWMRHFTAPHVDGLPPFWGGAVGYYSYEAARYMDLKAQQILSSKRAKPHALATEKFREFEFEIYDAVAIVDHARRRLWLVHTVFIPKGKTLSPRHLENLYRTAQDQLRRYAVEIQRAFRRKRAWGTFRSSEIRSNRSEAAYRLMVRRAQGHIAAGDIYQSNLSQIFSGAWEGDPWTLYRRLTALNPSPYAALWRSGSRWMVSASPELLLRQEADQIETRPIAGTYPRNPETPLDPHTLESLMRDAKERAEHIMLVDLERNDLGRVCEAPTVRVAEALAVETYSHVVHLVSDIRGQLQSGKDWKDVLQACFPGGTITGCPKIRCMELIDQLESQRRGPYCGSLGWIGFNGDITFNILIRTYFLDKGRLCFPAGAGIVADSDPQKEYAETLHKAQALMDALEEQPTFKFTTGDGPEA